MIEKLDKKLITIERFWRNMIIKNPKFSNSTEFNLIRDRDPSILFIIYKNISEISKNRKKVTTNVGKRSKYLNIIKCIESLEKILIILDVIKKMCNNCDCESYDRCSMVGYKSYGNCCQMCVNYNAQHTCEYYETIQISPLSEELQVLPKAFSLKSSTNKKSKDIMLYP